MKQIKTIQIACETKDTLKLEDMTVMQGGLKIRDEADYEKIKKSILRYKFSFPFFLYKDKKGTNWLIDGTGRYSTLSQMQKEGFIIPDLPVVYVQCKDKKEAKQKLLRLNSQFGRMTRETVLEFASDIDVDFGDIALPDTTIDFTSGEEEIPPELDETEGKENPYKVGMTFMCEEDIETFISKYADTLKEEFNCYISVSGGNL